ncbi:hypothetical protein [Hymenobacter wooponensis]|uniref:DUF7831 domain-containing protein n=1 Tax=Hymenobacter wooponensis TaxID=1525360 RepID=UPI001FDA4A3B|nr:hypothetical protein [Hymenobacter wooponensis]
MKEADFWTDETLAKNCQMIDEDLAPARHHLAKGGTVVVPEDGLGTGLAQLEQRAPQTFAYLEQAIQAL